jgi:hypothetical protein
MRASKHKNNIKKETSNKLGDAKQMKDRFSAICAQRRINIHPKP